MFHVCLLLLPRIGCEKCYIAKCHVYYSRKFVKKVLTEWYSTMYEVLCTVNLCLVSFSLKLSGSMGENQGGGYVTPLSL